ncbi:NUDIX hydrolase [Catenulispora sp. NF23]|uniref:NUDIX domain-containing protein n=1 Tax=Catenulispora pinistramenti TaxID=2705254 RepID=UPI001BAD9389|nr:NUDIX hydrolase [Catenulispora pinistramenti]MBS2538908.1 NUDIX hydrolase [Catenulispora pinistramenti]
MNAEPETARLTADVVVLGERDSKPHILLIRRGKEPYAGHWALPGGHVNVGEDTEATAHRELVEETGLAVQDLDLVGVYAAPGRDPRGRYVDFVYAARVAGLPAVTGADDAKEARWVPLEALLHMRFAFDHAQIIRDAVQAAL